MSRIGKLPIPLPSGVEVKTVPDGVQVKGPKGMLSTKLPGQIAMVDQMSQQAQEVVQMDLGDGTTLEHAMEGLGAAMEIGVQLAMLDGMDPTNPSQATKRLTT